jgi:FkbM family methyltransferase
MENKRKLRDDSIVPCFWQRFISQCVQGYVHRSPIVRGKTRLLKLTSSFLIAQLEDGPWMRVTGLSGTEWQLFKKETKEPGAVTAFRSLLKPGLTILDVGANVGYFSLIAASLTGITGRVIAFEPTPSVFDRLQENIALNHLANVTAVRIAVSDENGTAPFFVNPDMEDSEGNSLLQAAVASGASQIRVPLTTLDVATSQLGLKRIDLLKIDVEGNEIKVLRGAHGILRGAHPPQILMEINPQTLNAAGFTPEAVFKELRDIGYRWTIVDEIPWRDTVTKNILASPNNRCPEYL